MAKEPQSPPSPPPQRELRSQRVATRARLLERPSGPGGPGRMIERWFFLWRWETWASDGPFGVRPRAGWSLTFNRALTATQDRLDDYQIP